MSFSRLRHSIPVLTVLLASFHGTAAEPGDARIARWQGDREAAFVLMFDDSSPSHVKHVIPELVKRKLLATFYVNPGKGGWQSNKPAWEVDYPALGMEYGNHTMTHEGVRSLEEAVTEIDACTTILRTISGDADGLMSFGRPGVAKGKWTISEDDLATVLARNGLVERPTFSGHGAMVAAKTAAEMTAHIDKAIADGSMGYLIFHGVGGDWIVTPLDVFTEFLDELVKRQDRVWVTTHMMAYRYAMERDHAQVTGRVTDQGTLALSLSTTVDAKYFHDPLTVAVTVPAAWKACRVDGTDTIVPVNDGVALLDVKPGEVVVRSAKP